MMCLKTRTFYVIIINFLLLIIVNLSILITNTMNHRYWVGIDTSDNSDIKTEVKR